jgi:site-specific recombinase XerD
MNLYDELNQFDEQLYLEEKSDNTIKKYIRDVKTFIYFISKEGFDLEVENIICKSLVMKYKSYLREKYNITSANSMIASINEFFKFIGRLDFCVKQFKIQKSAFCDKSKELTFEEYNRLVKTALTSGNERLAFVLQTICATGIRISELQYITIDAVERGHVSVSLKNKTRTVFLVKKLRKNSKNI